MAVGFVSLLFLLLVVLFNPTIGVLLLLGTVIGFGMFSGLGAANF